MPMGLPSLSHGGLKVSEWLVAGTLGAKFSGKAIKPHGGVDYSGNFRFREELAPTY